MEACVLLRSMIGAYTIERGQTDARFAPGDREKQGIRV